MSKAVRNRNEIGLAVGRGRATAAPGRRLAGRNPATTLTLFPFNLRVSKTASQRQPARPTFNCQYDLELLRNRVYCNLSRDLVNEQREDIKARKYV